MLIVYLYFIDAHPDMYSAFLKFFPKGWVKIDIKIR